MRKSALLTNHKVSKRTGSNHISRKEKHFTFGLFVFPTLQKMLTLNYFGWKCNQINTQKISPFLLYNRWEYKMARYFYEAYKCYFQNLCFLLKETEHLLIYHNKNSVFVSKATKKTLHFPFIEISRWDGKNVFLILFKCCLNRFV